MLGISSTEILNQSNQLRLKNNAMQDKQTSLG